MIPLGGLKRLPVVFLLYAATVIASPAQTFNTLVDFDFTDGAYPQTMSLVQGRDGNLYGTTFEGGANNVGTVFKITPEGALTTYSFNGSNGAWPLAGLVLATDGNFYGVTQYGGSTENCYSGCGTVFRITPEGMLTVLHMFDYDDGAFPTAALVQASDGNFYGTTSGGGSGTSCISRCGTVFKITPEGTLTTLHNFNFSDGDEPNGLLQATDGDFYGTTTLGGTGWCYGNGCGTVFKITPAGKLTTLHNFDVSDGNYPNAGLIQATDGNFYGTTYNGGAEGDGTVFKITSHGKLTTLYSFCVQPFCADGLHPLAPVVQANDGDFYGTTEYSWGGTSLGTVFKITSDGRLTTLHTFHGTDGAYPASGLVQATNGTFYGANFRRRGSVLRSLQSWLRHSFQPGCRAWAVREGGARLG